MTTSKTEFQAIDTTFIQTNSLAHFMGGLGYTQKGDGFETENQALKHIKRLSYSTAVQLHNLNPLFWKEDIATNHFSPTIFNGKTYAALDMHISGYGLQQLMAVKLVKQVKLVVVRGKGLVVQSHMVKPQTPFITRVLGLRP